MHSLRASVTVMYWFCVMPFVRIVDFQPQIADSGLSSPLRSAASVSVLPLWTQSILVASGSLLLMNGIARGGDIVARA